MQKLIYKPTGAEVTAPDGLEMPPDLFEPLPAKPKASRKRQAKPAADKESKEV